MDLLDKIYTTKDYKNDICELYSLDRNNVISLEWNDTVTSYPLTLTETERDTLFDTFLAEFTPLSYTEVNETTPIGNFQICYMNANGYENAFNCQIFPSFNQTIALLDEYLANMPLTQDYGTITASPLERYSIVSIDIYNYEGEPFYSKDPDVISALKEHLILADDYYKKYDYDSDQYYDGTAEVTTYEGRSYISIILPKSILDPYLN